MKVTVLDTETGEARTDERADHWYWSEGNGSCDCNRRYLFKPMDQWDDGEREGFCVGCHRFIVTAAEDEGKAYDASALGWLNSGYSDDLLKKHGIEPRPTFHPDHARRGEACG